MVAAGEDQESGGSYVLGELIGRGGMGAVYAATGPHGEELAVKFLHEHLAEIPEFVGRFQREARIARRIRSEFVATVYSAGRTARGSLWIAYERLRGETLQERLAKLGLLPVHAVRGFIDHVLLGLQAAHQTGIIHRDIKPGNIFIVGHDGSERARILDFGLSKYTPPPGSVTTTQATLTRTAEVIGTVTYMAPEQAGGAADVDSRADLYATAVVAFEALTGRLPFEGESPATLTHFKLNATPLTLAAVTGATWPELLEAFLSQGMARDAAERFSSAGAMLNAWRRATIDEGFPDAEMLRRRLGERSAAEDTVIDARPTSRTTR